MAATFFTPPSRALDSNGNPYSGAIWYFYATGTLTPQAVYSDAGLTTSIGATVTADTGGKFANIYFDETNRYRAVCKNSTGSVTLHDIDPVNPAAVYNATVYLDDYILPGDPTVSGYPDASAAIARAAADGTVIYGTPGAIYYIKDVELDGRRFDGRNCVLRDAPGAKYGIRIKGYAPALMNFSFQDQGNYVSATTLSAGAAPAAVTIQVTSASGMAIGDVIFVELDANELRHQTFITGVAGTTITIRDALPAAAASGKAVESMLSAVGVRDATDWLVEDVLVINARGAFLTMPPSGLTSNKGSVNRFKTDGSHYYGWIKAGDCAGVKAYDVKLWCGYVETFNHAGTGGAGPFSFTKKVFLLRDVTVAVNGAAQVYGVDWDFASQTEIQFLVGHYPANGASIVISHFRDGYRGFVEDQRGTSIISGGNMYDSVETLDAFVGASFFESDLTEVRSLISDSNQYVALQTSSCTNNLVFSGDCFLGFSGSSLKSYGSLTKTYNSLYTNRVPLAYQWLGVLDDNIYVDAASVLRINAGGWSGEFQSTVLAGGKFFVIGGWQVEGRNVADIPVSKTYFLTPSAAFDGTAGLLVAAQANSGFRAPRDGTLKTVRVDVDTAPGVGQSYTYDVLVSGASIGQLVTSGAATFSATGVLNSFVNAGDQIHLRLVTSAGADTTARHFMQVVLR